MNSWNGNRWVHQWHFDVNRGINPFNGRNRVGPGDVDTKSSKPLFKYVLYTYLYIICAKHYGTSIYCVELRRKSRWDVETWVKESRERMPKINIDMRKIIDGTVLFIYSRTWRCPGDVLLLVKRVCYRFYPPHNYSSRSKEISRSSSPLDDRMQRHFFFFFLYLFTRKIADKMCWALKLQHCQ